MKILIGHNYYQQPGGEDAVFRSEAAMLKSFGHEICLYERRNDEIQNSIMSRWQHAASLRWSKTSYEQMRALLRSFKPDIAHFHNTFYVMTPSVFYACRDEGVPVALSLHNFRLVCLNGLLFRDGHPCEDCLPGSRLSGIVHRCYRGSLPFSILAAQMTDYHWQQQTWGRVVDQFVVATQFSRQKFITAGLSADKIAVLPHFLEKPAVTTGTKGHYALYAGRLSQEKGVDLLLEAWENVRDIPLYIVGGGPLEAKMQGTIKGKGLSQVKMLGFLDSGAYQKILSEAKFLVVPSVCYENFPRVVVEAYAHGVPVVANRLGTMAEVVQDGVTGLLFSANDPKDLGQKAKDLMGDQERYQRMCRGVRQVFESTYAPPRHYQNLMAIYQRIIHG